MIRKPRVAGQFYPAGASGLKKQIESLVEKGLKREAALGLVSPHAGYTFSGSVAGACFSRVKLSKTIVVLGPNHTGQGAAFSIMTEGAWQTPLGDVETDTRLAREILANSKCLQEDTLAHLDEHSIEVQLPFLQFFSSEVKIVPMVLSPADFFTYDEIGKAIAKAIKGTGENSLIVASSDMSHYETQEKAKANDDLAIESILKLDGRQLLERIKEFNITMCGYGPIACMLSAVKELGAKKGRLIKYQTSGDILGDYSSVVGYAGIMVE